MYSKPSQYRIIAMGKTGSGKSSVLNSLCRSTCFEEGSTIHSHTKAVKSFKSHFRGDVSAPEITFIDTPGFFDSGLKDSEIASAIVQSLSLIKDGVNLVLFCFPAYDIRIDASIQASLRFLELVMGKAVYEHMVIVLTHGNRLFEEELEVAVARMTKEFIPFIKEKLGCKIRDEVFIYNKNNRENDGLEDLLRVMQESEKYRPEVVDEIEKCWEDPSKLLENSEVLRKIQRLVFEVKDRCDGLEADIDGVKRVMEVKNSALTKKARDEIDNTGKALQEEFNKHRYEILTLKEETLAKIRKMRRQMEKKDKTINLLQREIDKAKSLPRPRTKKNSAQSFLQENVPPKRQCNASALVEHKPEKVQMPQKIKLRRATEGWKYIKASSAVHIPHKLKKRSRQASKEASAQKEKRERLSNTYLLGSE